MRVTPRRVINAPDAQFRYVSRDHPVERLERVFSGNHVFAKRGHIEERCAVADRSVFAIVLRFVTAGYLITCPPSPGLRAHQRRGARMEGSLLEHGSKVTGKISGFK